MDADQPDLAEHLAGLAAALQQAVPGYVGLRVTVVHTGLPVTLTVPGQGKACSSLGIPLTLLSDAYAAGGRVVFYSAVPRAFVDLAADLTHLLDPTQIRPDMVEVDVDVDQPLSFGAAMPAGLEDLATLHRALGYLIGQGNDPDTAHETLRVRAAAAGLTMAAFARQLLKH